MNPDNRESNHPGIILLEDFLEPMGIPEEELAVRINEPLSVIQDILKGERNIDNNLADKLSRDLGTSREFWLNLAKTHTATVHQTHSQPTSQPTDKGA